MADMIDDVVVTESWAKAHTLTGITRAPEYVHQLLTTGGVATTLAFECRPYFGNAGPVNVTIDFLSASMRRK